MAHFLALNKVSSTGASTPAGVTLSMKPEVAGAVPVILDTVAGSAPVKVTCGINNDAISIAEYGTSDVNGATPGAWTALPFGQSVTVAAGSYIAVRARYAGAGQANCLVAFQGPGA